MSDNILDASDMFDDSADLAGSVGEEVVEEIGQTSEESLVNPDDSGSADDSSKEKKSLLSGFSLFDSMLLTALICISLATLFLFLELNEFGKFPGSFPWRTTEFLKN
ncbi:MAG: hypothetical protein P8J27_05545 [Mariniblastus sp.]|nr:hypothetical protein [Mariniblastus sp.]